MSIPIPATTVAGGIPFRSARVVILRVDAAGVVTFANSLTAKRELLALPGQHIACWPGQYRQDAFVIDDVAGALEAIA